jgi:3-methylcrotonyl-CoA carboxylase beta subunit
MGGAQAAKVLLQIEVASAKARGEEVTPEREKELLEDITARYETMTKPYYAASRLWVDAIIDPARTREWLSAGIEMADCAPLEKAFNTGVLQV